MDITRKNKLQEIILFIFLIIFPFGQLLKLSFQPIDVIVGLAFLYILLFSVKKTKPIVIIENFLIAAMFSLLFSLSFFGAGQLILGILYLLRLTLYVYFILFVYDYVSKSKDRKDLLFNGLILVCLFSAIFGWLQYFWFPDFRSFTVFGWDDHLLRLIGTFLDPGFTSIVIVFGTIATLYKYIFTKNRRFLWLVFFFILTLAFTYSRAGYVSLAVGGIYLAITEKKIKQLSLIFAAFIIILLSLPGTEGEGVRLERTASANARLLNYSQTIKIIQSSPLFGVGFNNICLAKSVLIGINEQESHACSGADSSLLLILATTGVVGFIIFLWVLQSFYRFISLKGIYGKALIACSFALFTHSLFVNSLFYPWVMGWIAVLMAISLKKSIR